MKKSVFCILLALFVSLFTVAAAESTNCCACCSGAKSAAEDDTTPTAYVPKYTDADYTQEVVLGDFRLFLPSVFETDDDDLSYLEFRPSNEDTHSSIIFTLWSVKHSELPFDGITSRDELLAHYNALIAIDPGYTIIQADECYGLMETYQSNYGCTVSLDITNIKDDVFIAIRSDTLDEALELAQGIIDHAVAKEIPLDELEQGL